MKFWQKTILALILGLIVGLFFQEKVLWLKAVGDGYLSLIRMVLIPLVFSSISVGICTVQDPAKLGRVGILMLLLYGMTTLIGVIEGLVAGVGRAGGLEGEAGAPALLHRDVAVEAEAETLAGAVGGHAGVLRARLLILVAEADVAAELELGDLAAEVEFAGGGVGGEILGEVGAEFLGLLVVDEALLDEHVDEWAGILGHDGGGGEGDAATEGEQGEREFAHVGCRYGG